MAEARKAAAAQRIQEAQDIIDRKKADTKFIVALGCAKRIIDNLYELSAPGQPSLDTIRFLIQRHHRDDKPTLLVDVYFSAYEYLPGLSHGRHCLNFEDGVPSPAPEIINDTELDRIREYAFALPMHSGEAPGYLEDGRVV